VRLIIVTADPNVVGVPSTRWVALLARGGLPSEFKRRQLCFASPQSAQWSGLWPLASHAHAAAAAAACRQTCTGAEPCTSKAYRCRPPFCCNLLYWLCERGSPHLCGLIMHHEMALSDCGPIHISTLRCSGFCYCIRKDRSALFASVLARTRYLPAFEVDRACMVGAAGRADHRVHQQLVPADDTNAC